jgi:hypothetical protein
MWLYMSACVFIVHSLGYITEVGFLHINIFLLLLHFCVPWDDMSRYVV